MTGGPDLAMRVRVAAAHHRALVLEDLHVRDPRLLAEARDFVRPGVHHGPDLAVAHARQREVVPRREAEHAADPGLGLAAQERLAVGRGHLDGGAQRGEIVVEGERARVGRIALALGAPVARTERAVRVVGRELVRSHRLRLSPPRPVQPPGRAQHPFVEQRVVAPLGLPPCRQTVAPARDERSGVNAVNAYTSGLVARNASPARRRCQRRARTTLTPSAREPNLSSSRCRTSA